MVLPSTNDPSILAVAFHLWSLIYSVNPEAVGRPENQKLCMHVCFLDFSYHGGPPQQHCHGHHFLLFQCGNVTNEINLRKHQVLCQMRNNLSAPDVNQFFQEASSVSGLHIVQYWKFIIPL